MTNWTKWLKLCNKLSYFYRKLHVNIPKLKCSQVSQVKSFTAECSKLSSKLNTPPAIKLRKQLLIDQGDPLRAEHTSNKKLTVDQINVPVVAAKLSFGDKWAYSCDALIESLTVGVIFTSVYWNCLTPAKIINNKLFFDILILHSFLMKCVK